jgi:hypothetical protein
MLQWVEVLDTYEAVLRAQQGALDADDVTDVRFVPVDDLGPIPPALADRARELLAASLDLEAELAGALAAVREDLTVARRVQSATAEPGVARFIDEAV